MVRLVRDSVGLVPKRGVEERRRRALYRKVSAYDGDWLKLLCEKPDARRLRDVKPRAKSPGEREARHVRRIRHGRAVRRAHGVHQGGAER